MSPPIPLSIADLASVAHGESIREGLDASVMLASAQLADAVLIDRVKRSLTRQGRPLTDDETRAALDTTQGRQIRAATRCTASGTPDVVVRRLEEFATLADADELIVAFPLLDRPRWFRSAELLAEQLRPALAGAR